MKKAALLLVLILIISSLSACTGSGSGSGQAGSESTPPAAQQSSESLASTSAGPVKDTITIATPTDYTVLDPHNNSRGNDQIINLHMYEALVFFEENGATFEPRLAERWETNEDGSVYTFYIQPDAYFHNGNPVTSDDVVFSYERCVDIGRMNKHIRMIESVEAVDDKTVVITLNAPAANYLLDCYEMKIINREECEEQGDKFGTVLNHAGTGSYKLVSYDPAQKLEMEAFPEYYRGEAPIKKLTYRVITDESTSLIAFEKGEIDWLNAPIANWPELSASDKYNNEMITSNQTTYICINYQANEVLANDNVRFAIAHAIDKEAMNIGAYSGFAVVTNFLDNPERNAAAPTETLSYEYNPELAKQYLADAGYPDGVHIGEVIASPGRWMDKCAEILQAQLEEIGITCTLNLVESNVASTRATSQDYDLLVFNTTSSGDYQNMSSKVHTESVGSFYVNFKSDKFDWQTMDEIFDAGIVEMDPVKRKELYTEANNMIMETACYLPIFHKTNAYVWNKDLNVVNRPTHYDVWQWSWK